MGPTDFVARGIAVVPVFHRSKRPMVPWRPYQQTLPTPEEMARWFRPGWTTNAAVICGWRGLTVLDFDTIADYAAWCAWALDQGKEVRTVAEQSYRVLTARGVHVYLFCDETPRCGKFSGGDIKGHGGYVLIPPSIHPSGVPYVPADEAAPILRVRRLSDVLPDPPSLPTPRLPDPVHVATTSGLWPRTIVEQIREEIPITTFFSDVSPSSPDGRWYIGTCPWHDDRSPSLRLDTQAGLAYCWSGCTPKPLDVIGVYGRLYGVQQKEAIKTLARLL